MTSEDNRLADPGNALVLTGWLLALEPVWKNGMRVSHSSQPQKFGLWSERFTGWVGSHGHHPFWQLGEWGPVSGHFNQRHLERRRAPVLAELPWGSRPTAVPHPNQQEPWTEGQGNSGSYSFSWMQKASWKEHSSSLQPCHLPLAGYHFNPGVLEQPLSVNQSFFSETATLVFKMMAFFPYHSEINITKAWPYVH